MNEILIDQANKLSCSSFKNGSRGLFQEAAAIAPSKDQLLALPITQGWKILRGTGKGRKKGEGAPFRPIFNTTEDFTPSRGINKGVTRQRKTPGTLAGEIETRIQHRLYQAAYWLSSKLSRYATGKQTGDKATVYFHTQGNQIEVVIINRAEMAGEVASRTGYLRRAIESRQRDLMEYLNDHMDKWSENFRNKVRIQ